MQTDFISEMEVSPQLVRKAVDALLRLPRGTSPTYKVRTITILDMLIDEGIVEQVVETGIAIQARLDAYVELMACPALAELHPMSAQLSDDQVIYAIANAPLRIVEGRYRFCLRGLLTLLLKEEQARSLL